MEKKSKFLPVLLIMLLPLAALPQLKPTSYDSDGDGIPDSVDKCMLVPGLAQFQGCPYEPLITAADRDGDGVPDAYDACPDMFGLKDNHGCPDMGLINNTTGMNNAEQPGSIANSTTMFTSTSSSQAQQLNDFKDNLLAVLASSGKMFADIKTSKDEQDNDYKTALCLAGADECYIDLTSHFYATYGTYTDLDVAMARYESLRQNLIEALGEGKWTGNETIDNGTKSFEMRKLGNNNSFSPRVSAFVQQTEDNSYRVYLTVDSK